MGWFGGGIPRQYSGGVRGELPPIFWPRGQKKKIVRGEPEARNKWTRGRGGRGGATRAKRRASPPRSGWRGTFCPPHLVHNKKEFQPAIHIVRAATCPLSTCPLCHTELRTAGNWLAHNWTFQPHPNERGERLTLRGWSQLLTRPRITQTGHSIYADGAFFLCGRGAVYSI